MTTHTPKTKSLKPNSFLRMIESLVESNELILYGQIDEINLDLEKPVIIYLGAIYGMESKNYPFIAPKFDSAAASWSSKLIFNVAQLVMFREHDSENLEELVPIFDNPITASAMLTADICLRFLPDILDELEKIDVEDPLIPILKNVMRQWHYSGLLCDIDLAVPNFLEPFNDQCLLQLYVNRVIDQKNKTIGQMNWIKPHVESALGNYRDIFWKEFNASV